jgi:hypothetical protein
LELASGCMGALLFSHCNVVWRSFVQAGGSGSRCSWCFFSAKCGFSISAKFLICGAHAVCFFPLVAISDLLQENIFWFSKVFISFNSCIGGFIVIFPYMLIMYPGFVHPLYCFPILKMT